MKRNVVRSVLAILLAVAGLLMIAREITQDVLVQQFSPIFVAIGLAVIALGEYLWEREFRGERITPRKHEAIRVALLVMEAFVVVTAVDGGLALLRGALDQFVSVAWLAGTPFSDYTIPALTLVIVVGGSALLAEATVFLHREWAVLVSLIAGLLMAGYEVVEAVSIDGKVGDQLPIAAGMQLIWFVPGVAIFGLAWFLWNREYRSRNRSGSRSRDFHPRPA